MTLSRVSLASLVLARGCDDLCIEAGKWLWRESYRRWRLMILVNFNIIALARHQIVNVKCEGQEELMKLVTAGRR